jgi:hypothetical protein
VGETLPEPSKGRASQEVAFHVKAHVPIDYTGTADGDSMKGTLTGRGKTGEWTASRAK